MPNFRINPKGWTDLMYAMQSQKGQTFQFEIPKCDIDAETPIDYTSVDFLTLYHQFNGSIVMVLYR